jgi:hypothetical protein
MTPREAAQYIMELLEAGHGLQHWVPWDKAKVLQRPLPVEAQWIVAQEGRAAV